MRAPLRLLALGLALILPTTAAPRAALALDVSAQVSSGHFTPVQAAAFAKTIERDLGAKGARVAIVFRSGRTRDRMPKGIDYTHGAFWVHRQIPTADGGEPVSGYAVYNLYAGDGKVWPVTQSRLVQDWPIDFVTGAAVDDVAVIIPSPEMQRRILAVIDSPAYAKLHNPAYALVSNPLQPKYQNCTAFMLDVIAAAAWQTDDPARILANLRAHYTPTVVKADSLTLFFGPLFDARLRTDDQKGKVLTAEYDSMARFMAANGLIQETYKLTYVE